MGRVGRLIDEHDWPHSADFNSLWYATAGIGYVMEHGDNCAPSVTGTLEITVSSGRISVGLPETHDFAGGVVTLNSNEGEPYSRYDLIYLAFLGGTVTLQHLEGVPAEHPVHPTLPFPPAAKVVPIAVVRLADFSTTITELKDCRTVLGASHNHTAGLALELTENAAMNVVGDESTISTLNDYVELMDGAISWSKLGLTMGDGLEGIDTSVPPDGEIDTLQIKKNHGLAFDIDGALVVNPDDFAGDGLEDDGAGNMQVIAGDGLQLTAGRVKIREGEGIILRGTTPDRKLDIYTQPGGGLAFDGTGVGRLYVNPDDFAGDGLIGDGDNNLEVVAGDGLQLTAGRVKIREGEGIILRGTTPDRTLDIYTQPGGGLAFDGTGVGRLYVNVDDFAGGGLENDGAGNMQVIAGDGLQLTAGRVKIREGEGIILRGTTPDRTLDIYTRPGGGLGFDTTGVGRLRVIGDDIAGPGLAADGVSGVQVDAGDGIRISAGRTTIDYDYGLKMTGTVPNRVLDVDPSEFTGIGLYVDVNNKIRAYAGDGIVATTSDLRVDAGEGLAFDAGTLVADANEIFKMVKILDVESATSSQAGYIVSNENPVLIALSCLDDRDWPAESQRFETFREEIEDEGKFLVWVKNVDGDYAANFHIKIYEMVS